MNWHYILDDDGEPKPEPDLIAWGTWMVEHSQPGADGKTTGRHVAFSQRGEPGAEVEVSTVFLGSDHAFNGGPPVLFETMVFGGPLAGKMDRYTSRADASRGHAAMVARVEAALAAAGGGM